MSQVPAGEVVAEVSHEYMSGGIETLGDAIVSCYDLGGMGAAEQLVSQAVDAAFALGGDDAAFKMVDEIKAALADRHAFIAGRVKEVFYGWVMEQIQRGIGDGMRIVMASSGFDQGSLRSQELARGAGRKAGEEIIKKLGALAVGFRIEGPGIRVISPMAKPTA